MKQLSTKLKIVYVLEYIVYYLTSYFKFKYGIIHNNIANITITAHTGCNGKEWNSIESLEDGYKSGAQILEFDLYFDKNGVPCLSHGKLKGNEIKLEDAFKFFANISVVKGNIDVKNVDNMPAVFDLIKSYNLSDRVFFTGVKEKFVEAVKKGCPGIKYYLNYRPKFLKLNSQQYLDQLVDIVKKNGALGINMRHDYLSKKLIGKFHEHGLLVSVWTVDSEYYMLRAMYYGPDNITTKRPSKLRKLISKY